MSKCQIIFFPTFHEPNDKERKLLEIYQEEFKLYEAELIYLTRDMSEYSAFVFRESSHQNIRRTWKVIESE